MRPFSVLSAVVFLLLGTLPGAAAGASPLEDLVAKAKASNHVVTMTLESVPPEIIRAKEKAFEERFGFSLRLETEPGHHRKAPVKIMQAAKAGRGVVDMWDGGLPLILRMFKAGHTRQPPWDAIYEGWPLARKLRATVPAIKSAGGASLRDHCLHHQMGTWTLVYNTRRVKAEELKGIKYEDLTDEKWRNRVVWDVRALGLYALPFAPGWNEERMRVYAHNLGANGTKLVSGGTSGVLQALIQGEGDIGVAAMTQVVQQKTLGAPLELAFAGMVLGNLTVSCLIQPGVNDPNMAALYWGWNHFDGNYAEAAITGGGVFRMYDEEADRLPLVALARRHGVKSVEQIAGPKTEEQAKLAGKYRKTGINALKAGIKSKKKIAE
jgi:ABC-type Fe3+ transport system substrate-binding protein